MMIKLHHADNGKQFWLNEKHIEDIEIEDKGTVVDVLNGLYFVIETPEEILALMGETTQPAPVKNNITKWLENMNNDELRRFMHKVECKDCPAYDRCCEHACYDTLKHWALEISE